GVGFLAIRPQGAGGRPKIPVGPRGYVLGAPRLSTALYLQAELVCNRAIRRNAAELAPTAFREPECTVWTVAYPDRKRFYSGFVGLVYRVLGDCSAWGMSA